MSKESPLSPVIPGFAEIQEFWQRAFKQNGALAAGRPNVIGDLQAVSTKWMTHRQDDFGKAVDTFKKISSCKDPAEAIALQQKWLSESFQSLMSDWMELINSAAAGMQSDQQSGAENSISIKKGPAKAGD